MARIASRSWIQERQKEVRSALLKNPAMAQGFANIQRLGYPTATLNPSVLREHTDAYTHEIPVKDIEDQAKSGRCWIFRCNRLVEITTGEKISLSAVYPYFWHLFLQADRYLIEVAKQSPNEETGIFDSIPDPEIADGGWDEQFFSIARFAGMVPEKSMPEVAATRDTSDLNRQLNHYLARIANEMLKQKIDRAKSGASKVQIARKLRELRELGLSQIYQSILVKNLGEPPMNFSVRSLLSKQEEAGLIRSRFSSKKMNPHQFMKKVLGFNPDNWIFLARHPMREMGRVFQEIESDDYPTTPNDPEGIRPPRILNLSIDDLLIIVEASIRQGIPVGFAGDVLHDVDNASGVMMPGVRRNPTDIPADQAFSDLSVADAMLFGVGDGNHAMVISGYDKPNPNQPTLKYKVVNSWGKDAGDHGFYHMYRSWAEKHLYSIMVPRHILPRKYQTLLRQRPIRLDENFWTREPHEKAN